jgi:zinc finger SWIM domain-containing protein 3
LCSWHIEQNALKQFRGLKLKDFRKLIYYAMEEFEFESLWTEFRDTHNIKEDNLWMNRMYELRHKWAATFTRGRRFFGHAKQSKKRGSELKASQPFRS